MKVFYVLLFLFSPSIFFAQEYTVSGKILDESRNPIVYANVLLLKKADSTFMNYKGASTDEDGVFNFNTVTLESDLLLGQTGVAVTYFDTANKPAERQRQAHQ